jgi:N-methylhydantoinase A
VQANGGGNLIGVDVGGTFTDVVLVEDAVTSFKAFTVPGNEAQGVMDALAKAAEAHDRPLESLLAETRRFVHGTTVAANALLEKTGARTAFIATAGFRDTLVMRRMLRENMYDLHARVPENILRREWILEARERVDRDGHVLEPLTEEEIERLVGRVHELEVEAVGICLLFSFRNPKHERGLRDAIQRSLPQVYVVASSDIAPEIRDYERASTTALSAYLAPTVATYLLDLEARLGAAGLACELQIMRSNGGVCSVEEAVAQPVDMLLSGPAGGVVAAMNVDDEGREPDVISFDMGGTSCDLSVVRRGRATSSTYLPRHTRFEGWDVLVPFLDIHALGAGGGSIAWLDQANGLHVGPRSAGANPGPACYGRGGTTPTVADANLALGYLNPDYFLHTEVRLDSDAAMTALETIAGPLGYSTTELAAGIFTIVNHAMADGIRVVLADKGYDARDFTLLCFGGAGGIHAPALIDELGIRRLLVPLEAATLSALGMLYSDIRYDFVQTLARPLQRTELEEIVGALDRMREEATERLVHAAGAANGHRFEPLADMRYSGQTHELRIPLPDRIEGVDDVARAYESAYANAYGYVGERDLIQLVNLRLAATATTPKPAVASATLAAVDSGAGARKDSRDVFFTELADFAATEVYDGDALAPGSTLSGPAVVELPATTIVVRPGQRLSVDKHHNFVVEREGER